MKQFGVMNSLTVVVCEDSHDAEAKGFVYPPTTKAVEIEKVVVVRNGTVSGKPTVDLILKDEQGNQYVVAVTGALLKSIPCGD